MQMDVEVDVKSGSEAFWSALAHDFARFWDFRLRHE